MKLLLLGTLVLVISSNVLVGGYTRSASEGQLFDINHFILITETGKVFLNCFVEFFTTGGRLYQSLQTHIIQKPVDTLTLAIPALLYVVQNSLSCVALSHLTAPVYQVLNQSKLVLTAAVSVMILRRSYTITQWFCLLTISLGVAIVVLAESQNQNQDEHQQQEQHHLSIGLVNIAVACLCSAFAGVYFEKKIERSDHINNMTSASLYMRNIQLSSISVVIAACQRGFFNPTTDMDKPYFHGFTVWVWIFVGLQVGAGLHTSAVIKHSGNVLKGQATALSTVLSSLVSLVLLGNPLTASFIAGATIIVGSVYLFSNPLPEKGKWVFVSLFILLSFFQVGKLSTVPGPHNFKEEHE